MKILSKSTQIQGNPRKSKEIGSLSQPISRNRAISGVISSGHPGNPSKSTQNHENPCKTMKILSKSRKSKEIQGNRESQGSYQASQRSHIHIQASESSQNHQNPGKSFLLAFFSDLYALFRVLNLDFSGVLKDSVAPFNRLIRGLLRFIYSGVFTELLPFSFKLTNAGLSFYIILCSTKHVAYQ